MIFNSALVLFSRTTEGGRPYKKHRNFIVVGDDALVVPRFLIHRPAILEHNIGEFPRRVGVAAPYIFISRSYLYVMARRLHDNKGRQYASLFLLFN